MAANLEVASRALGKAAEYGIAIAGYINNVAGGSTWVPWFEGFYTRKAK